MLFVILFGDRHSPLGLAFLQHLQRTVHRNPIDPCSKVGTGIKPCKTAVTAKKCFLNDLLRVRFTLGNAKCHAKHTLAMTLNENAVCLFVSGQNRPDQRLVAISHARIRSEEPPAVRKFLLMFLTVFTCICLNRPQFIEHEPDRNIVQPQGLAALHELQLGNPSARFQV